MTIRIASWELAYLKTLDHLLSLAEQGQWRGNRTGVRTAGGFGLQLDVDLSREFPALLTKTVHLKSVIAELLWFLKGENNIAYLKAHGVSIWDEWADKEGDLGPIYGVQWRMWPTRSGFIDQIQKLVWDLRNRPESRRMIVTAWNPAHLPDEGMSPQKNVESGNQALAPCHMLFQAYVQPITRNERLRAGKGVVPDSILTRAEEGGLTSEEVDALLDFHQVPKRSLSLRVDQRSADWVLGVPFNVASYALLTHMLCAQVDDLVPGKLVMQFGDYHLYENQQTAAREQLLRYQWLHGMVDKLELDGEILRPPEHVDSLSYPTVKFRQSDQRHPLEAWDLEDIQVLGYMPWGKIAAPVAV